MRTAGTIKGGEMTTDNNRLTDEARIRELIEERVRAIRAEGVDVLVW